MDSNEKMSSVAPIVGGFALGAVVGLLLSPRKRPENPRTSEDDFGAAHGPLTPQELAEEFDLTANL